MEKETDIEALARMIADGFSSIDKRFDGVDQEFKVVHSHLDHIQKVGEETNRLMDNVILPTQDDHARRIKDLELKIA